MQKEGSERDHKIAIHAQAFDWLLHVSREIRLANAFQQKERTEIARHSDTYSCDKNMYTHFEPASLDAIEYTSTSIK